MTAPQCPPSLLSAPFVRAELRRSDAWVILDRPPHNAVNPVLALSLMRAIEVSLADQRVRAVVLSGSSKCFAAGADLGFFLRQLESAELSRIETFSQQLHQLCELIATATKPVVAMIRGPALGAGLELALACRRIVASRTATIGLPETGLGICPGSGGTQRVPRRIGLGLAKWLIYTGQLLSGQDAMQLGLIDDCVGDPELEDAVQAETGSHALRGGRQPEVIAPPNAYQLVSQTFEQHSVRELLALAHSEAMPLHWDVRTRRAVAKLKTRSAAALTLAERLIDGGQGMPLPAALRLEIDAQREMFLGGDALPRLRAAFEGRS